MKQFRRVLSAAMGVSVLLINGLPVYGKTSTKPAVMYTSIETGKEYVMTTGDIIIESLESITIEDSQPVTTDEFESELITVYEYSEPYAEIEDSTSAIELEEFSELDGQEEKEEAYQLALDNYNAALAEYEAASQMIETTKEVEVEIIEEVMDDQGNVSEQTRRETQTVTEMAPVGDVDVASENLNEAKIQLDHTQKALQSNTVEDNEFQSNESIQMIDDEVIETTSTTEISQSEVESKIYELIAEYEGKNTWPTINDHANYGWMCYNFAHFVFNTVFERTGAVGFYTTGTEYKFDNPAYDITTIGTIAEIQSASELESLLELGAPGDYLQVRTSTLGGGPHSMIIVGVDKVNNVVDIFDAYSHATDKVYHYSETFTQFMQNNEGVSIYRYKGYTPGDHDPKGDLESIGGGNGTITLSGWAYDPDDSKTSIDIKVYVGGSKSDANATLYTVTTSRTRTDINKEYGINGAHGFAATLTTDKRGNVPVYVYASNVGDGQDVELASALVIVKHKDGLPFADISEDAWYYSVAKECYDTGLINGTSDTMFSPMQPMTKAMVVTILWRMEGSPSVALNDKFKDVSSKQWYAASVAWAEQEGIVHGYGDGTFKPDAAVTREQVAVMLANYAQYKGVYTPGTKKLNTYPDGSQVSAWAESGMKWAITNGIISGNGEGYLNPKKSATRAEGAAMLLRMKNWL